MVAEGASIPVGSHRRAQLRGEPHIHPRRCRAECGLGSPTELHGEAAEEQCCGEHPATEGRASSHPRNGSERLLQLASPGESRRWQPAIHTQPMRSIGADRRSVGAPPQLLRYTSFVRQKPIAR